MPTSAPRSLGSRIARLERADFVGRRRELVVADSLFTVSSPASVLLVHGPGGIGKSMLLREIARRGKQAGWTPFAIDARDLAPVPDAIERALAGAWAVERPLVLLDTYERMSALGSHLRSILLPSLPARTVVVIASRDDPEPGWFEGGWESVTLELPLSPLSAHESRVLLGRLGLDGDRRQSQIVNWAGGMPLSLRLGATAARADEQWSPGLDSAALHAHLRRVAEAALEGPYARVFALGCVARTVTATLVADVLPELEAAVALRWLANSAFADSRAGGVALHETVRRHLREHLRLRDPALERELRAKVADSLHVQGELALTIDLADLVCDDAVRAGYSWEFEHHVSAAAPDDVALAPDAETRAFFAAEPSHVLVARDAAGAPAGYAIAYTTENATALALNDHRLGPWLRHAPANAIVWRDSVNLTDDPRSRVQALLNMASILDCGLRNPRYAYLPIDPGSRAARTFSAAVGARHVPALDVDGVECHVLDYGPGGLLGAQRDIVHRELGVARAPLDAQAVRDALRRLHDPSVSLPVSREVLRDAAERAFGDTADEQLLRQVLLRGYFDPASSHEAAARSLHLSRAAYFRRLRAASERVAAWLARPGYSLQ
jgi:hypothetical protein